MKSMIRAASGLGVLLALVSSATSARAHHSFTPVFDMNRRITIAGTLVKVDWRNPHIHLDVEAHEPGGTPKVWNVEAMPPTYFAARGITKTDFEHAVGQTITVDIMGAKDGSASGLMQKITFPDGRVIAWQGS